MRIIRFEDDRGRCRLGIERPNIQAECLSGVLFDKLHPSGELTPIIERKAPLEPSNIYCIGLNYREHANETGQEPPQQPVIFMKPTSAVIGPAEPIRIPAACDRGPEVDYEGELAVIIGKAAYNVDVSAALDYVFGYTCANDISARRWQKRGGGGQWIRGKSFDTFCPLGPALVTKDELPEPQHLQISTRLNGELMQQSSTANMIFSVASLVSFISRDTTLLPGTVILTGTPPGVGVAREPPVFLKSGDQVTVSIEGIGELSNPVK